MTSTEIERASREFVQTANGLSTLMNLTVQQAELLILLNQVEDDTWSESEREALQQKLEHVDAQLLTKVEAYCGLIRKLERWAVDDELEIKHYRERKERKERHIARLRQRLLEYVKTQPNQRVDTATATVSVRANPPAVEVLDASLVPSEYQRTKIEISVDKRAVLDAYKKEGELVPGTTIKRGERLEIA